MNLSTSSFLEQWRSSNDTYINYKGQALTYSHIYELVICLHELFVSNNACQGNVAIFADNSPEFIIAYFATSFSASTCIPINTGLTKSEIISEIHYCDCNWIVCQSKLLSTAIEVSEAIHVGVVEISPDYHFRVVRPSTSNAKRQNLSDIAVMLHTSGTTGSPKKVMLTHKNLFANTLSNIESLSLRKNDPVLIALPLFFGYCHTAQFLTHTRLGATIVIYDQPVFNARHFCYLIEKYSVCCFTAVPTMLGMIDMYKYLSNYNLFSLRYICFGGGGISIELLQRLMERLPKVGFVQTYGQTECSPRVTALLPHDSLRKIGSVGKPIPGVKLEIVIRGETVARPHEIGEIRVSGNNVTPGYYKRNDASQEILKNGWLYTGDLAFSDQDGFIYLIGRKKNIIISGGINIYPEEIESVIRHHAAVKDVLIKGQADDLLGEIPVAHVLLNEGMSLTVHELCEFLSDKIAKYKLPRRLVIDEVFSKTATGKIKRNLNCDNT